MHPSVILREQMELQGLVRLMAAHSPLSARLVAEAGFDGIWASGFELSALYGLPDASLITMTQHLEMVRAMAGQCRLPILADLATGFGNAINVLQAIELYEQAGAAGVVLEDKTFPKMTSLAGNARQELVRVEEFQGKIEAALTARRDPSFLVIARTEALIAGLGIPEALRRAAAYAAAGADLILVHSKQPTPMEVENFIHQWKSRQPLVLVPTSYPELTEKRIRESGKVKMVIYGNHAIRASVQAMQRVFARIIADGGSENIQSDIASVEEIFRLQNMPRLRENERRFLR